MREFDTHLIAVVFIMKCTQQLQKRMDNPQDFIHEF